MNIDNLTKLSNQLVERWENINGSLNSIIPIGQNIINAIVYLQSQPDFATYADEDEQNYLDLVITFLNNLIINLPQPPSTNITSKINQLNNTGAN